jgi:uncharacterized membrane protein (UPF0127 family)
MRTSPRPRFVLLTALLIGTLVLSACRQERPVLNELKPSTEYFPLEVGGHSVRAQLAVLEAEMAVGLMYRSSLAPNDGMLFVYAAPRAVEFWMRNTLVPLDIGFFDANGVLREIHAMQPNDDRSVPSQRSDLQFALEVNQGWFSRAGVKPGAQLDLGRVKAALRARGFELKRFGLE